jgi:hypothetical protein
MSTRRERPSVQATRAATDASRLSRVLAAGMERKLSLKTCLPCKQSVQKHAAAAAATDLLLDYESEEQMRKAGARFLAKQCPEDEDGCDAERDGVPFDPISYDEFEKEGGRGRDATRVMILGCGHAFTLETVQKHNRGRSEAVCPLMRTHPGGENGNYLLNPTEQDELGFTPAPAEEIREEDEDGDVVIYVGGPDGEVLVRIEFADGTTKYYEGPRGEEHIVRIKYPDDETQFYEGPKGEERQVKIEYSDGTTNYYEGLSGEERLVRMENSDGDKYFYEGPKDEERKVRRETADGYTIHYEGAMDEERIVRIEHEDYYPD